MTHPRHLDLPAAVPLAAYAACRCAWHSDEGTGQQCSWGSGGVTGVPLPQQQQKEHRLWVTYYAQISGLLLSQWTGDLSGSQAMNLEGSEGGQWAKAPCFVMCSMDICPCVSGPFRASSGLETEWSPQGQVRTHFLLVFHINLFVPG